MPMIPKDWHNYPTQTDTPVNRPALQGLEQRVANYVGSASIGTGVANFADFQVQQTGVASMTLNVGTAIAGVQAVYIALDALGSVERYENTQAVQQTVVIGTADPTNPRIDRVVAVPGVTDSQIPTLAVLPGTPTGGASLDNLTGAAAVPVGRLLLADVLVAAGATSIANAAIQDRRGIVSQGVSAGAINATLDQVAFSPHPCLIGAVTAVAIQPAQGTNQYGALFWLPRRIVGATKMRWKYQHSGTALTGNYQWGIYEPGGRLLAATGSIAFTGAANSIQLQILNVAAVTLEAGAYIIYGGCSGLAGGAVGFNGVSVGIPGSVGGGTPSHGTAWVNGGGLGLGIPIRLQGTAADLAAQLTAFATGGVPAFSLSQT